MRSQWNNQAGQDVSTRRARPVSFLRIIPIIGLLLTLSVSCRPVSNNPTDTPETTLTLAFLGDVMLGRGVQPTAHSFAYLEPYLQNADLALANLESPLSTAPPQPGSGYVLCAPPGSVRYLVSAGIDLLSLANNHRLDCGAAGLAETQSTLQSAGLGYIGPDARPVYRILKGTRLAFLAFDATGQLGPYDSAAAVQAVRAARQTGAVVIVSMHWGLEYQSGATPEQKEIASQLAQAGAALIWGQHPHVLQPAAWIGPGNTLVLYSLGNALFDQAGLANTRQSALVLVRLDTHGVLDLRPVPFVIDVPHSQIVTPDPASVPVIMQYFQKTKPGK